MHVVDGRTRIGSIIVFVGIIDGWMDIIDGWMDGIASIKFNPTLCNFDSTPELEFNFKMSV